MTAGDEKTPNTFTSMLLSSMQYMASQSPHADSNTGAPN